MEADATSRAIVKAFLDRLGHQNDADGMLQLLSKDVEVWTPFSPKGLPTRFRGKAEIGARFGEARKAMSEFRFLDVEILATEDPERWIATCRSEGKHNSGGAYENAYCWVFTIRNNHIHAWTEYYDAQSVMPFIDSIQQTQ